MYITRKREFDLRSYICQVGRIFTLQHVFKNLQKRVRLSVYFLCTGIFTLQHVNVRKRVRLCVYFLWKGCPSNLRMVRKHLPRIEHCILFVQQICAHFIIAPKSGRKCWPSWKPRVIWPDPTCPREIPPFSVKGPNALLLAQPHLYRLYEPESVIDDSQVTAKVV